MTEQATTPANASTSGDARSDAQLMRRLAGGHHDVMAEILRRHHPQVWRLAYRLSGNSSAADDLAQEAFLRLYQSAPRYRPEAALPTFLHRIVVNLAIDARRRRRPTLALNNAEPAQERGDPLVADERARQVQDAIAALPDRQRAALVLHRYELMPCKQVAQVLDVTESAAESLLIRAYAQLRQALANVVAD